MVVPVLIAINVAVFLFIHPTFEDLSARGDEAAQIERIQFVACEAAVPYEVMHGERVFDAVVDGDVDGRNAELIAAAQGGVGGFPERGSCRDKNVWLSILYSMFLHGGLAHIGFNMLFLWVFGNNIEDRLGRVRFLAFYLLAGLAATYAQAIVSPDSTVPLIGASGAIAGVLGAYLVLYPRARVTTLVIVLFIFVVEMPAVVLLGLWFLLQVFQGVGSVTTEAGGVAYMAHAGGFVAGMGLLLLFRPAPAAPQRAQLY